jgi:aspartate oxidase
MVVKGTNYNPSGEQHPLSKLTKQQVQEIRTRYAQGGISMQALGAQYDVTASNVCSIVHKYTWR